MSDNGAPFPGLRSAYLRAIARAWRENEYKELLIEKSKSKREKRGVLPMLEKDFGFTFPFDVKFAIVADRGKTPKWKPGPTGGWFGFADEFKLYLPEKPDPDNFGRVLARYCAEFPSLLGKSTHEFRVAPPDFAAFGVITSRVLALTWDQPKWGGKLFRSRDARGLVQGALDTVVPWNFALKFVLQQGTSSDSDRYWKKFPRSEITVNLPESPGPDVEAIALVSYNDTGSQYPFTC